jgi:hypothetical protein
MGRKLSFIFRNVKERSLLQYGFGNRCTDGKYVLFLDYDDTPLEWVLEELRLLQRTFKNEVGTGYVFQTKNGFHVVFLEKHFLGRIVDFMNVSSCDKNYKEVPMQYARRVWILRQSKKKDEEIKYLGAYIAKADIIKSLAHRLYLHQMMNVPIADMPSHKWFDTEKNLYMGYYRIPPE